MQSPKAVIRETLQWYSVESAFSEYLANAEDCMDKEGKMTTWTDWMIDRSTDYLTKNMITPKLRTLSRGSPILLQCWRWIPSWLDVCADIKALLITT